MEFDSGFVSTVITALGIGGGGGAWLHKWFTDKRNALPLQADWEDHPEGWSVTIELINRLNEDIFVDEVDAKAAFFVPPPRTMDSSVSRRGFNWTIQGRRILPRIRVDCGEIRRMTFYVSGVDTPRWIS
jgi:hypothetical protein